MTRLTVDTTKSLKDLIAECNFDWVSPDINDENYPIENKGVYEIEAKIFKIDRVTEQKDIILQMQEKGLRVTTLPELLAWEKEHKSDFVVALCGSSLAFLVRGSAGKRRLYIRIPSGHAPWAPHCDFLGVYESSTQTFDTSDDTSEKTPELLDTCAKFCSSCDKKI